VPGAGSAVTRNDGDNLDTKVWTSASSPTKTLLVGSRGPDGAC